MFTSYDDFEGCDELLVLLRQENRNYRTKNYLVNKVDSGLEASYSVDKECRFRMVEWCYLLVEHCDFKRETVAIAFSCLDRFVSTIAGLPMLKDRNNYQLAAMTAFYISIKINESKAMESQLIANLSQGIFSKEQIEAAEIVMLDAIQWLVHPPTAVKFLRNYLNIIPEHLVCGESRPSVIELSEYQVGNSLYDSDFLDASTSTIALASLLNAFERMNMDPILQQQIEIALSRVAGINTKTLAFHEVRSRLFQLLVGQIDDTFSNPAIQTCDAFLGSTNKCVSTSMASTCSGSPRSVSIT